MPTRGATTTRENILDPLLLLLVMLLPLLLLSIFGKRSQARRQAELDASLTPGVWVMTMSGFYGKLVEIDGETVTLESPSGDETLWSRRAIGRVQNPPFANALLDEEAEAATDEQAALDDTPETPEPNDERQP
nr:preprotein translocase subunit YajC [Buchananella hordeovulneris]